MLNYQPNTPLWSKIRSFNLDDPTSAFPFSRKLSRQQKWSMAFTQRAITEYKRFIYLSCILPGGASPSAIVDEVWHLHLVYTRNYWEDFCGKVLGRQVHHHPSRGGPEERTRHLAWQERTRDHYRSVFGEPPPPDIWPPAITPGLSVASPSTPFLFPLLISCLFFLTSCQGAGALLFFIVSIIGIYSKIKRANASNKKVDEQDGWNSGGGCTSACSAADGSDGGCGGCGGGD